jgi:hypothetical protein
MSKIEKEKGANVKCKPTPRVRNELNVDLHSLTHAENEVMNEKLNVEIVFFFMNEGKQSMNENEIMKKKNRPSKGVHNGSLLLLL